VRRPPQKKRGLQPPSHSEIERGEETFSPPPPQNRYFTANCSSRLLIFVEEIWPNELAPNEAPGFENCGVFSALNASKRTCRLCECEADRLRACARNQQAHTLITSGNCGYLEIREALEVEERNRGLEQRSI
jgi:hypothetical protein